ncbi:uncharacterized protein LOC101892747 [Musca domestica]|uniref:Uncharacterized protein LOC101892747 n=1 Tax=Musca domestica TaxID=7370 RepID=A0A9J7D8B6_MUSDO|nr:uncharacterized protein LOC101892747 [Musca domestica]
MKNGIFSKLCYLYTFSALSNVVLGQNCQLTDSIMNRNWIFLSNNDLLRTDYIADGGTLTLYCNEHSAAWDLKCTKGTLEQLPYDAVCSERLSLSVVPQYKACSADGANGQLYDMVYSFATGFTVTLYTICYCTSRETVLYSIHKAYGFNLPTGNYQRPQFKLLGNPNRARADSFGSDEIYKTFQTLLGDGQTYVKSNRDYAVQRGHMANSQDFLTYDQMDATFLYMNVVPMFRGCNLRNWKRIENWIHRLPDKHTYATVVTGTHDVLYLQHSQTHRFVPMYLMPDEKNPMPMWMYKVVRYQGECYVFATLNDVSSLPAIQYSNICRITACPAGLTLDEEPGSCVSYCCGYRHFVQQVGDFAKMCSVSSRPSTFIAFL